ncbi:DUF2514 domain-containing protein [Gibbsiella dentisursi]|uniref:DUF2514 domain-containing protein n=1 Tax=Gibbsiella dentisursi TaxID=796890 RepID=A0ABP7M0V2_9GAMM
MTIRTNLVLGIVSALLIVVFAGSFSHWRYTAGENAANASWQDKWDKRNTADAQALAARQAEARTEEQRRQTAINQVTENADKQLAAARSAATDAQSAADGLRVTLRHLQQQLAGSEAARNTAVAAQRQARADTRLLLARVLEESVERNQQLAAYADRARLSGLACEQAYDAITNQAPTPQQDATP